MKRVLVIGDTILDVYYYGEVNRISPEAPVPVFDYIKEEKILGGACNVAANIRTLLKDKQVQIDYFGFYSLEIQNLLLKYNIDCIGVPVQDSLILKKERFVCDKHQLLRVDNHKQYKLWEQNVNWLKYKQPNFSQYDVVVVSDYDKGTLTLQEFETLREIDNNKIIDLKRVRHGMSFSDNCILKCNEKEFILNPNIVSLGGHVVVTKGSEGYHLPYTNERFPSYRNYGDSSNIIDVVGAGDVFLAGMCVRYLELGNFDLYDMSSFGNMCAGEKVKHFGTVALDRDLI